MRPLLGAAAVSPPLTVEAEHLEQIADAFRFALDRLDAGPAQPDARSGP